MGKITKISHLNEENYNTYGTKMKIIFYNGWNDIIVKFLDDYRYEKKEQL